MEEGEAENGEKAKNMGAGRKCRRKKEKKNKEKDKGEKGGNFSCHGATIFLLSLSGKS